MELKTGYKQTELGKIPEDWNLANVESFSAITTGDKNTQDKKEEGRYPFFVRSAIVERINTFSYDGEAVLTAGDGVGTGKIYHYINGRFDFHQRVYKISDFAEVVDGKYFFYQFSSRFYDRIMSMTAKSSVDSVRMEMIADMLVPLPSVEEQRAIAAALSDVDALIAALGTLIAKKRAIKTAAMQQLLTGKQRLPGFSGMWEVKQLGEISHIKTGGKDNQDKVNDGTYPFFVRSQEVERINSYSFDGEAILVPGEGGIGSIFHYIDGKFDWHQRVYKISDFPGNVSGRFVYNYMMLYFGEHAMRNSVKATVDSLRLPTFKEFEVRLPTYPEQQAIAAALSDMDAEIKALDVRRAKTQQIKQGMMQELLTGKTRLVSSQQAEASAV